MQFYGHSVSLYNVAIDKLNRQGLSNTTGHDAKEKSSNVVLATEGLTGSTNKLEHFNYKGEWANAWASISIIKVSGRMGEWLQLHVIIST